MRSDLRSRPDFFVLGAAKCGTTSLCAYLAQHPDVFFGRVKEPTFFESEYERGLDHYWQKYFSEWSGQPAVGDGRTYHLFLPFVAERIRESVPAARLIAILRDPVDRAHSHWWHRFADRNESLSFPDAIRENLEGIRTDPGFHGDDGARRWREGLVRRGGLASRYRIYLDVGLYAEQLRRYLGLFGADQMKVVLYDDLQADPQRVVGELWRFLGVDDGLQLADTEPRNTARTRMRSQLDWKLTRLSGTTGLGRFVPRWIKDRVRRGMSSVAVRRPPMEPEVRERLIEFYAGPNVELAQLLGRDLAAWRGR